MSVNDQYFSYPDATPNLNDKERARLNKKFAELLERLRATCKHIIKSDGTPVKRKRGSRQAIKQYLNQSSDETDYVDGNDE